MRVFTGQFVMGKFIPAHEKDSFNRFTAYLEKNNLQVDITIAEPSKSSVKQINLFNMVITKASELSGYTFDELVLQLYPLRPKELTDIGFRHITVFEMNTTQLSEFIKRSIIFLNNEHNLKLEINTVNGVAQITG